ncbi:MAG: MMPL family transporter [Bowdeniella nasicola]|nr:MMPL family transporter [Bowdeniella nasicola]
MVSTALHRLGNFSVRRAWLVVGGWLIALAALFGLVVGYGGQLNDSFEIPGTEAQDGLDVLNERFPEFAGASGQIVFEAPEGGHVTDYRHEVGAILDEIGDLPHVMMVTDPYGNEELGETISDNGRYGLAQVQLDLSLEELPDDLLDTLLGYAHDDADGLSVLVGGPMFAQTSVGISMTEVIGVLLALVVLAITFRSLLGASVPIFTAIIGVAISMALMLLLARGISISSTAPTLALMLGIAVGIDYALFIVSRHRQQLADGMAVNDSAARATATAGGAVMFAGGTVIIALLGLFVTQIPFLAIMGATAALAVAIAVAVAITMIPAVLSLLGERLRPKPGSRAERVSQAAENREGSTMSDWWVGVVTRHPVVSIVACVLVVAALALPARDLQLSLPGNDTAEEGSQARRTYELIADQFGPGVNDPLLLTMGIIQSQDPLELMDEVGDAVDTVPGVDSVQLATPNRTADIGVVAIVPETSQSDPATADLVNRLREKAPDWEDEFGVTDVRVTGQTAAGIDISQRLSDAMLPFGIVVVGLSLILLTLVFRSLWVPLKATVGYLFSVLAAFGAVTIVFEYGFLNDAIGIGIVGPVISFMPVILMGVLFGLAMDYEVFLVTRMREDFVHHGDAREAVRTGFSASARVVTAAALIMISVFVFFVPEGSFYVQPIALGLAVGVAIDAFVVRMTLVPAVMTLLGKHAWHLPAWLSTRLPYLDIEGESIEVRAQHREFEADHGPTAVRAEHISLSDTAGSLYHDVDLTVPAGSRSFAVVPDPLMRRALAATLAGRTMPQHGRLVVAGASLPAEAGAVRTLASLSIGIPKEVRAQHIGQLLVIDCGPGDDVARLRDLEVPSDTTVLVLAHRSLSVPGFDEVELSFASAPQEVDA